MAGSNLGTSKEPSFEELQALAKRAFDDPGWWFRNWLGWTPWAKQVEIAEAVRDHKHVCVPTGNAIGKSAVVARIALWWAGSRDQSIAITTAPTERQVKEIVWSEINRAFVSAKVPLAPPGQEPSSMKFEFSPTRRCLGITAPEYDPNKFQGIRQRHTLIIVDESCGITPQIFDAIDGMRAGGDARLLEIGNPTDPNTPFAEHCADPKVHTIQIGAFDTPNFTAFGITEEDIMTDAWKDKVKGRELPMPWLVQPEWAADMYRKLGPTAPEYQARVRGQFPQQSTDSIFPLPQIKKAMKFNAPDDLIAGQPVIMACDVARYGQDKTVIGLRQGQKAAIVRRYSKLSTMQVVGALVHEYQQLQRAGITPDVIRVDVIGVGAGVVDRLEELGMPVEAYTSSESAFDDQRFLNTRAEAYWHLRDLLEAGFLDLPDDEILKKEMGAIKWKVSLSGKIQIESKDEMRRRGMPSPDTLDTIVTAYYDRGRMPGDFGISL